MRSITRSFWVGNIVLGFLVIYAILMVCLVDTSPLALNNLVLGGVLGSFGGTLLILLTPKKTKLTYLRVMNKSAKQKDTKTIRLHAYIGISAGFLTPYLLELVAPGLSLTAQVSFFGLLLVSVMISWGIFMLRNSDQIDAH